MTYKFTEEYLENVETSCYSVEDDGEVWEYGHERYEVPMTVELSTVIVVNARSREEADYLAKKFINKDNFCGDVTSWDRGEDGVYFADTRIENMSQIDIDEIEGPF